MKTEDLGNSKILNLLFKPAGLLMGSGVRRRLFDPMKTLQGADVQPGQVVLEVGCGTGFFTIPAARIIGEQGSLVAMDASSGFLEQVSKKVQNADLKNVHIVKRDALDTRLDTASIDKTLLFWCDSFPFVTFESAFTRNASCSET